VRQFSAGAASRDGLAEGGSANPGLLPQHAALAATMSATATDNGRFDFATPWHEGIMLP
jgi:hypothetical protein